MSPGEIDTVIDACKPQTRWHRLTFKLDLPEAIHLGTFQRSIRERGSLRAIVSIDLMDRWQAGWWLHMSVSRPARLPSWNDLVIAREELGYGARMFVQLLPPVTHWLNTAGFVLHMFHRIDGDTTPRALWDQEGCDGKNYRKPAALDGRGQVR